MIICLCWCRLEGACRADTCQTSRGEVVRVPAPLYRNHVSRFWPIGSDRAVLISCVSMPCVRK